MSEAPVVSIVTPAYNAALTVQACIDSVTAQTFKEWEMVIVDDGSSDDTLTIIEAAAKADPRIRPIHANRGGAGAARNRAISAARGTYIAFLDADDLASPGRLAAQIVFLESHPEVDVVGGAMQRILPDGSPAAIISPATDPAELARSIYKRNPFFMSTVMARRRFFDVTGVFGTDLRRAQDYDLWLRGHRAMRYANLPDVLAIYRASDVPRWRDARFSALVIFRNARRHGVLLRKGWCAFRPLLGFLKYALLR